MARKKRSPLPEGDDGKTIANMNVDGMPWYIRDKREETEPVKDPYPLSPAEMRTYRWAAVKAGLLVVLIFGAVFAAFIAICDFVWFK